MCGCVGVGVGVGVPICIPTYMHTCIHLYIHAYIYECTVVFAFFREQPEHFCFSPGVFAFFRAARALAGVAWRERRKVARAARSIYYNFSKKYNFSKRMSIVTLCSKCNTIVFTVGSKCTAIVYGKCAIVL